MIGGFLRQYWEQPQKITQIQTLKLHCNGPGAAGSVVLISIWRRKKQKRPYRWEEVWTLLYPQIEKCSKQRLGWECSNSQPFPYRDTKTNTFDFSVYLCPKISVFAFLTIGTQIHEFWKKTQSRHTHKGSRYTRIAKIGHSRVSKAPMSVSTLELFRSFSNKLRWLRLVRFQSATSPIPLARSTHTRATTSVETRILETVQLCRTSNNDCGVSKLPEV